MGKEGQRIKVMTEKRICYYTYGQAREVIQAIYDWIYYIDTNANKKNG